MKTYYKDQNGTFFCEYQDHLDRRIFRTFDTAQKDWQHTDWGMHKDQITEVTEEQMKTMLSEVDWVNKPVENKEEKNKTGIFKRILNFFKK